MMPVPTLAEQEAIVALLRAVDDATTADEAVVEQLDRVRQDLVEDLLQHGLPGTGGGTPQWKQGTLGEYLREPIRNGYSPVCPSEPTGRWTLGLGAVTPEGFNPGGKKPAPVDDPHVQAAKLEHGDVLVSRSNTRERVGLAGVYRSDPPDSSYPDLMMRVRPAESLLPEFLECQLLAAGGRRYFEASARGTSGSMVKINRRILEAFPVVIPPLGEQRKVIAALGAVAERVAKERAVVAERRRLKAALTDALLTGTIRIPGVNGA
jgi:type I restriction enzyme S subunit